MSGYYGRVLINDGAEERRRSADTAIFSRVLYHLSYLGRETKEAVGETGLEPVTFRV